MIPKFGLNLTERDVVGLHACSLQNGGEARQAVDDLRQTGQHRIRRRRLAEEDPSGGDARCRDPRETAGRPQGDPSVTPGRSWEEHGETPGRPEPDPRETAGRPQ
eukprot:gene14232-biopygen3158